MKIKSVILDGKLSRKEMKNIVGGTIPLANAGDDTGGGSSDVEVCNAYSGCPSGCVQRAPDMKGGWKYMCNTCCIA